MLYLYNTLTRKKEEFRPASPPKAGLYTCGPTVYDYAHIGNLRTFIFEDILRRVLEFNSYEVKHVMNITDVGHLVGDRDMGEDKLVSAAREKRKTAWELAKFYEEAFLRDMTELNIEKPHVMPRATEHIGEQIALIRQLEEKGFTYGTSDGVYFDTQKYMDANYDYAELAHIDIEGLKEGARVEANPEKKNPTDFALWKFSYPNGRSFDPAQDDAEKRRHMEWESHWGIGFPGWHIECSAMSAKYLGQPFDIHTGGVDHIPVHHTNEIAQSKAASGKELAKWWLHGEFLLVDEGRMAKSLGNFYTLADVQKRGFDALDFRFFCLGAHYRTKLNFTWEALTQAREGRRRLEEFVERIRSATNDTGGNALLTQTKDSFTKAINDDLNLPEALGTVFELVREGNRLLDAGEVFPSRSAYELLAEFDRILGLRLGETVAIAIPDEIIRLAREREDLRKQNQWEKADEVRRKIEELGYEVRDTGEGPTIRKRLA